MNAEGDTMKQAKRDIREAMRTKVLDRDQYRCRICGDGSSELFVHRITPLSVLPQAEFLEENHITLCSCCKDLTAGPGETTTVWNSMGESFVLFEEERLYEEDLYESIGMDEGKLKMAIWIYSLHQCDSEEGICR
jgi:hypothetical protein